MLWEQGIGMTGCESVVMTVLKSEDRKFTIEELAHGELSIDTYDEREIEEALRSLEARTQVEQSFGSGGYVEGAPGS
jgi:hypothetical protein